VYYDGNAALGGRAGAASAAFLVPSVGPSVLVARSRPRLVRRTGKKKRCIRIPVAFRLHLVKNI
jgi:hypothetical protein